MLVWLVAVLVACGGPATVTPAPAPASASRCVPASTAQMERVREGVRGRQRFFEAGKGWAVQSKDLSGESDQPGPTYSVDAVAKEFSNFEDGSKTDAKLDMSRDGAREAMECAAAE